MNVLEIVQHHIAQASPEHHVERLKKTMAEINEAYADYPHGVVLDGGDGVGVHDRIAEIKWWAWENVGPIAEDWTFVMARIGLQIQYEFRFKRSQDALHFKLRWVG